MEQRRLHTYDYLRTVVPIYVSQRMGGARG